MTLKIDHIESLLKAKSGADINKEIITELQKGLLDYLSGISLAPALFGVVGSKRVRRQYCEIIRNHHLQTAANFIDASGFSQKAEKLQSGNCQGNCRPNEKC